MDYFGLYSKLFNAVTDAVEHIENANYGLAKAVLKEAQAETEQQYIEEE